MPQPVADLVAIAVRAALPQLPEGFVLVQGATTETGDGIRIEHHEWAGIENVYGGGLVVPVRATVEVEGRTYLVGWMKTLGWPRLVGVAEAPTVDPQ